ncbi:MAG: lysophospholipid acyltransferase family protein [Byssovorax sp.]
MISYWIGKAWLKAFGWRAEGALPENPKLVLIAAPHTSNWDFPFMMATAYVMQVDIAWMGKHTLFEGPFGWFFKWMGGVPVDRRSPQNLVQSLAERFAAADSLVLAVPPEGTRGKVDYWKSGFYRIALAAQVPIALGFLDFERKVCGVGPLVMPTGDVKADMDQIRAFYAGIRGKHPKLEGVPRLRDEEEPAAVEPAEGTGPLNGHRKERTAGSPARGS